MKEAVTEPFPLTMVQHTGRAAGGHMLSVWEGWEWEWPFLEHPGHPGQQAKHCTSSHFRLMVSWQSGFSSFPKAKGYRLALSSDFGVKWSEPSMQTYDHLIHHHPPTPAPPASHPPPQNRTQCAKYFRPENLKPRACFSVGPAKGRGLSSSPLLRTNFGQGWGPGGSSGLTHGGCP